MSIKQTNILSVALLAATLAIGYLNFHNYPLTKAEGLSLSLLFALTGALFGYIISLAKNDNLQCMLHLLLLVVAIDLNTLLTTKSAWIEKLTEVSHSPLTLVLLFLALFLILMFFLSIRKNISLILLVSYFAFFISTLLLPVSSMPYGEQNLKISPDHDSRLPNTLHLVLDGHIGIAGIPTSLESGAGLQQRLRDFYTKWGFQLHEKAYSQHVLSQDSLSTLFNGVSNITETNHLTSGYKTGHRFKLTKNQYFRKQIQAGYKIRIIQSDYLDFCNSDTAPIAYCYNYSAVSPGAMRSADLPILLKTKRLARSYFYHSLIVIWLDNLLNDRTTPQSNSISKESNQRVPVKYFNTALIETLDLVKQQLYNNPEGSLIFAHLLIPHSPFIWDTQCKIKLDKELWLPPLLYDKPTIGDAHQVRDSSYLTYFDQIDCVMKQLNTLFTELSKKNMFSDLQIIIHADHGSRLTIEKATIDNMETVSKADIIDSFSTIFAIRVPSQPSSISNDTISLIELFSDYNLVENDLNPGLSGAPIWFRTKDSAAGEISRKIHSSLPFD